MAEFDRRTIYRSAFFAVSMQWAVRAIGLISVAVLARLLTPADFGIVAVALTAAAFVELFGWIGLRQALVRVKAPERAHYDTAWTIQLMLFLALTLVLVAIAPLVARFYGLPVLAPLLWTISLRFVCLAFVNIGIVDFERDMDFGRDMRMRLSVRVAALVTSLIAAVVLRNYWALIVGMVAQSLYYTIASYLAHPFRPRPDLSKRAEILGVSMWMFVSSTCQVIQEQMERLVLGRFAVTSVVGLYSVSKDLSSIFTQEIGTALNRVTFVTVSQSEAPIAGSGIGLARMIGGYSIILAPLAGGVLATAPDVIRVLLGSQWLAAAPYLQVIVVATAIQSLFLLNESILQASGFARRAALLSMAGAALMVAGVCAAAVGGGGAMGVAWAALAANAAMLVVSLLIVARQAVADTLALAAGLLRPAGAATAMALLLTGPASVDTGSSFLDLLLAVPLGAALYGVFLALLWLASGRPEGAESEIVYLLAKFRQRRLTV
jgi:lipopolysaccharide exporter